MPKLLLPTYAQAAATNLCPSCCYQLMPQLLLAKLPSPVHSDSDTLRSQWHTEKSDDKYS